MDLAVSRIGKALVMSETCKDCRWAVLENKADLRSRTCRGGPPQIVMMPAKGPMGQMGMAMQQMWPAVNLDHPICGAFQKKSVLQIPGNGATLSYATGENNVQ